MISYSPCKINLGLNIVERRADGYHNIETLFFCVNGLHDILELQVEQTAECGNSFSSSGILVDCPTSNNLCIKALELLQERFQVVGPARIHLHKSVPTGAGLGGGSANATEILKMGNRLWNLNLSANELESLAAELGSDTSFFVRQGCMMASGRGEILKPFNSLSLKGYHLLLAKPDISISTREAFSGVTPNKWQTPLNEILSLPISEWRGNLRNDFEDSTFPKFPILGQIKQQMYDSGAIFSSLSGSGATIFGIFKTKPTLTFNHFYWTGEL